MEQPDKSLEAEVQDAIEADAVDLLCASCRARWHAAAVGAEVPVCEDCDAMLKTVRTAALKRGFHLGI